MASIVVYSRFLPKTYFDYHEFFVYTNDAGVMYYIGAGPKSGILTATPSTLYTAANASTFVVPEDFAPIGTFHGDIVAQGSDASLQKIWNEIGKFAEQTNTKSIPYYALGPNSNGFVAAAMKHAGLPPLTDNALDGPYPAPGAELGLAPNWHKVTSFLKTAGAGVENYVGKEVDIAASSVESYLLTATQATANYANEAAAYVVEGASALASYIDGDAASDGVSEQDGPQKTQIISVTGDQLLAGIVWVFDHKDTLLTFSSVVQSGGYSDYGYNPTTGDLAEVVNTISQTADIISEKFQDNGSNYQITTNIQGKQVTELAYYQSEPGIKQTFEFSGPGATLKVDNPSNFDGTISRFVSGESIDLVGLEGFTSATIGDNNLLTLEGSGGASFTIQLNPTEDYNGYIFTVQSDENGGSLVESKLDYAISNLPFPSGQYVFGIDNAGDVAINIGSSLTELAVVDSAGNVIQTTTAPNGTESFPASISNLGTLVGNYTGTYNGVNGIYGVIYGINGDVIISEPNAVLRGVLPGALYTAACGINDNNTVVGYYGASTGYFAGFIDDNGTYTTVLPSQYDETFLFGVNDSGVAVGAGVTTRGVEQGMIDDNGTITVLDYPGAAQTQLTGINDSGFIIGNYIQGGNQHGFVYMNGSFTTIDSPDAVQRGVYYTDLSGINNQDVIVGNNGSAQSFTAIPKFGGGKMSFVTAGEHSDIVAPANINASNALSEMDVGAQIPPDFKSSLFGLLEQSQFQHINPKEPAALALGIVESHLEEQYVMTHAFFSKVV